MRDVQGRGATYGSQPNTMLSHNVNHAVFCSKVA